MAAQNPPYYKQNRLKQLRAFCQAAQAGSMSVAAERLFLSQPTVSLQIQALERELEIVLFDISAEELAADLSATNDLTSTGLYQLLVSQPKLDAAAGPFSAIVGNYLFEHTPPHADLLARLSQIAAAAGSPFLTGVSITSLERQLADKNPLCDSAWQGLREMPADETAGSGHKYRFGHG